MNTLYTNLSLYITFTMIYYIRQEHFCKHLSPLLNPYIKYPNHVTCCHMQPCVLSMSSRSKIKDVLTWQTCLQNNIQWREQRLPSWLNKKPDKVSQFFVLILAQRFNFKHMYISFILKLFNFTHNNDELWCSKILWILYWKLEKNLWPWLNLPIGGYAHVICMGDLGRFFFYHKNTPESHAEIHKSFHIHVNKWEKWMT